jgi:hypothetical protein
VRGVGLVGSGPVVRSSGVALEVGAHETVPSNKGLQLTGGRFHCRQRSLRRPQLNPGVGPVRGECWNMRHRFGGAALRSGRVPAWDRGSRI